MPRTAREFAMVGQYYLTMDAIVGDGGHAKFNQTIGKYMNPDENEEVAAEIYEDRDEPDYRFADSNSSKADQGLTEKGEALFQEAMTAMMGFVEEVKQKNPPDSCDYLQADIWGEIVERMQKGTPASEFSEEGLTTLLLGSFANVPAGRFLTDKGMDSQMERSGLAKLNFPIWDILEDGIRTVKTIHRIKDMRAQGNEKTLAEEAVLYGKLKKIQRDCGTVLDYPRNDKTEEELKPYLQNKLWDIQGDRSSWRRIQMESKIRISMMENGWPVADQEALAPLYQCLCAYLDSLPENSRGIAENMVEAIEKLAATESLTEEKRLQGLQEIAKLVSDNPEIWAYKEGYGFTKTLQSAMSRELTVHEKEFRKFRDPALSESTRDLADAGILDGLNEILREKPSDGELGEELYKRTEQLKDNMVKLWTSAELTQKEVEEINSELVMITIQTKDNLPPVKPNGFVRFFNAITGNRAFRDRMNRYREQVKHVENMGKLNKESSRLFETLQKTHPELRQKAEQELKDDGWVSSETRQILKEQREQKLQDVNANLPERERRERNDKIHSLQSRNSGLQKIMSDAEERVMAIYGGTVPEGVNEKTYRMEYALKSINRDSTYTVPRGMTAMQAATLVRLNLISEKICGNNSVDVDTPAEHKITALVHGSENVFVGREAIQKNLKDTVTEARRDAKEAFTAFEKGDMKHVADILVENAQMTMKNCVNSTSGITDLEITNLKQLGTLYDLVNDTPALKEEMLSRGIEGSMALQSLKAAANISRIAEKGLKAQEVLLGNQDFSREQVREALTDYSVYKAMNKATIENGKANDEAQSKALQDALAQSAEEQKRLDREYKPKMAGPENAESKEARRIYSQKVNEITMKASCAGDEILVTREANPFLYSLGNDQIVEKMYADAAGQPGLEDVTRRIIENGSYDIMLKDAKLSSVENSILKNARESLKQMGGKTKEDMAPQKTAQMNGPQAVQNQPAVQAGRMNL